MLRVERPRTANAVGAGVTLAANIESGSNGMIEVVREELQSVGLPSERPAKMSSRVVGRQIPY